ncbi:MAG TPA: hypothetical protein VIP56_11765 [Nitrososphaeraceae archaeon]|nr:hypothetical protein [Nitrososphaeraceae archaeon]
MQITFDEISGKVYLVIYLRTAHGKVPNNLVGSKNPSSVFSTTSCDAATISATG